MSKRHTLIMALVAIMIVSLGVSAHAHKPLLAVEDNMDGTIYIEAGFSDGSSAAGHKILIKEQESGKLLSEHRVGEDGTLEIEKPSVKYTVTLDAGEGHKVTQDGPAPTAGQTKADVAGDKEQAAAPPTEPKETVSSVPQQKSPVAAPAPSSKGAVTTSTLSGPAPAIGPGAIMAFKMMMITQVVTAVVLIILVVILASYVGYTMGRNSGAITRRKEV
jgi:hypothetical protein